MEIFSLSSPTEPPRRPAPPSIFPPSQSATSPSPQNAALPSLSHNPQFAPKRAPKIRRAPDEPVVTRLAPGVRDPNRVNVYIDGKFEFSLDIAQVTELGVKVGLVLTPERLAELRQASEFSKLYQRTLEWVLTRPHSVRETRDYLKRRQLKRTQLNRTRAREGKKPLPELDEHLMSQVVDRLLARGYLDDVRFAEFFVENRMVRKGISRRKLRLELQQKGLSSDLIDAALAKNSRPEAEEITKIIAKKRARYDDDKLIAYLVRQGFDYQTAKSAVAEYVSD